MPNDVEGAHTVQAEDRVEEAIAERTDADAPTPAILTEEEGVGSTPEPVLHDVERAEEASAQSVPVGESDCEEPQVNSPPVEEHRGDEGEAAVELDREVLQEEVQQEPIDGFEVLAGAAVVEVVEERPEGTLEAAEKVEEEKVIGNGEEERQLATDKSANMSADPARVEEHEEMPDTAALISSPWPIPPQESLATQEQPPASVEVTPADAELPAVAEEISHAPEVDLEEETREQPAEDAIATFEVIPEPAPVMEAKTPSPVPDAPVIEPEVPDPFIVDDPEEPADEPEQHATPLAADDVPLSEAAPPADAPQPPSSSESDQDEEEAPDLYLPELVLPTMFLPIPNVRDLLPSVDFSSWYSFARMYITTDRQTH
ncbi:uncharacterized protein SCHCODRAFT_01284785 [Schizophyllum commune H4-8]|uniref:uncharacterized protein n=1 Tax=Schizophyllum commune (strain H4-8 / FGSC 9210) TaxID=578458 RepID=UPI00215F518E|nr:uncharacterized protein SCHCODRAFT_01284785 [Schizophyllum commune H4-8]KAI5895431.1 hypothetical protein SCHCODRAFT_01284785 [Schizophyllum commune H4-8]